jgi:hypothetical protein
VIAIQFVNRGIADTLVDFQVLEIPGIEAGLGFEPEGGL